MPGWWEKTHMAMATVDQMKTMVSWLDNGRSGTWRAVKPAEGSLHFEHETIDAPEAEDIIWDGEHEVVEHAISAYKLTRNRSQRYNGSSSYALWLLR